MAQPSSPSTATISQWDKLFLHDIKAPDTSANEQFLNTWINREGGGNYAFNLLNTMQTEPGSTSGVGPNGRPNGIQQFTDVASGALANATALMNGRYNDILGALRGGNPDINAIYPSMKTWSGGGYSTLSGTNQLMGNEQIWGMTNAPAVAQANIDQFWQNQAATGEMQWVQQQQQAARQQAGFQEQNLLLSEADLATQQQALARQLAEAPQQQALTMKNYQQQFADMLRNYKTSGHEMAAREAASGSMFTAGGRDERTNLYADYVSSHGSLQRSQQAEQINYYEQIRQMQDQQQMLKRMSQRYGISEQEIKSRLAQQLSNIEYGGLSSLYPIMNQIAQDQLTAQLGAPGMAPLPPGSTTDNSKVANSPTIDQQNAATRRQQAAHGGVHYSGQGRRY